MPREDLITYEELSAEHKQKYDEIKALFEADLIGSFERSRHHGVRWKGFSPEGTLGDVDLSVPLEDHTRALRQEMNYMVAHSLHRHFDSLVNALERVALHGPRNHEASVLSNGTYPGESQRRIVVPGQATAALCVRGSRITWFIGLRHLQGGR
jgi:hypothetical protein